ncbi:MAG: hypothetical protein ABEJ08_03100 [Halobacteriaceae archaeon]
MVPRRALRPVSLAIVALAAGCGGYHAPVPDPVDSKCGVCGLGVAPEDIATNVSVTVRVHPDGSARLIVSNQMGGPLRRDYPTRDVRSVVKDRLNRSYAAARRSNLTVAVQNGALRVGLTVEGAAVGGPAGALVLTTVANPGGRQTGMAAGNVTVVAPEGYRVVESGSGTVTPGGRRVRWRLGATGTAQFETVVDGRPSGGIAFRQFDYVALAPANTPGAGVAALATTTWVGVVGALTGASLPGAGIAVAVAALLWGLARAVSGRHLALEGVRDVVAVQLVAAVAWLVVAGGRIPGGPAGVATMTALLGATYLDEGLRPRTVATVAFVPALTAGAAIATGAAIREGVGAVPWGWLVALVAVLPPALFAVAGATQRRWVQATAASCTGAAVLLAGPLTALVVDGVVWHKLVGWWLLIGVGLFVLARGLTAEPRDGSRPHRAPKRLIGDPPNGRP